MLDKIIEFYSDEEVIIADGFDEAIIGIEASSMRVIYSTSKCIDILMRDMSEEDAIEHFGYNVTGAYIGDKTPIFCEDDFSQGGRSPYCPVCSGCGEEGCCSALHCDPFDSRCHYGETYTADLKLGYSSFQRFWDLLEENDWFGKKDEFMKIYDEQLEIRFPSNGPNIEIPVNSPKNTDISYVGLSRRFSNVLKLAGIETIDDLKDIKKTDLYKLRNLGKKGIKEIETLLLKLEIVLPN